MLGDWDFFSTAGTISNASKRLTDVVKPRGHLHLEFHDKDKVVDRREGSFNFLLSDYHLEAGRLSSQFTA